MRAMPGFLALSFLITLSSGVAEAQVGFMPVSNGTYCRMQFYNTSFPGTSVGTEVLIEDFHSFASQQAMLSTLDSVAQSVAGKCNDPNVHVIVKARNWANGAGALIVAMRSVNGGQWAMLQNWIPNALNEEQNARQQAAARDAQQKQAAAEAEARVERRRVAVADCGSAPVISGGPWLSSTYKVAAGDAARNQRFLCVKTIEYVGPAVNPFGGNAARAKFIGYDSMSFQPVTVVLDFPY